MKKLFVLIVTAILAFQMSVSAQEYTKKNLYTKKVVSYGKMKNAGIGLTVGGVVLTVIGIATISNAATMPYDTQDEMDAADTKLILGTYAATFGIIATGGGITLWAIGGSKKRSYMNKLNSLSLNLNSSLYQKFSLAYCF
jgi:hypothetical protein